MEEGFGNNMSVNRDIGNKSGIADLRHSSMLNEA